MWDLTEGNLVFSRKRGGERRRSSVLKDVGKALSNVVELPREESAVPSMEPVANALIDSEPLAALCVLAHGIATTCFRGEVKLWVRPPGRQPKPRDAT